MIVSPCPVLQSVRRVFMVEQRPARYQLHALQFVLLRHTVMLQMFVSMVSSGSADKIIFQWYFVPSNLCNIIGLFCSGKCLYNLQGAPARWCPHKAEACVVCRRWTEINSMVEAV